MGFFDQALKIPLGQPSIIADVLFLAVQRGIYLKMKRDKKNTPLPAAEMQSELTQNTNDPANQNNDQNNADKMPPEINGPKGPEPTRYGDWEQKGRCTDF